VRVLLDAFHQASQHAADLSGEAFTKCKGFWVSKAKFTGDYELRLNLEIGPARYDEKVFLVGVRVSTPTFGDVAGDGDASPTKLASKAIYFSARKGSGETVDCNA
jgi:hypothetical protein